MKKTVLSVLAVVAAAATAFGQGTVFFSNGTGSVISFQSTDGGPIGAAVSTNGVKALLLWAPVGTINTSNPDAIITSTTFVGAAVNVGTPTPGRFSGGNRTIPGIAPGGIVDLIVVGFVGADHINPSHRGFSTVFTVDTGDPTTVPAGTATALSSLYGAFTVTPVPEPSSMALAGLGAASLLIFRRRK